MKVFLEKVCHLWVFLLFTGVILSSLCDLATVSAILFPIKSPVTPAIFVQLF